MWKKSGFIAVAAAALTLAFLPSAAPAADQSARSASVCAECCTEVGPCAALAALADLRISVAELVPDAGLANSLEVKVDAATSSVLALRFTPALNELDSFTHEVAADEKSGTTSQTTSSILKAKADAVSNTLAYLRG